MSADLQHVVLTRFNLPSKGKHEVVLRAQESWLKERVNLFETYCLPSMRAQTCQRFDWVIYFDPASPTWLLDWVRGHEKKADFFPFFKEEVHGSDLLADIRSLTGDQADRLLTTNLDNDDAVSVDFVARLQSAPPTGHRCAVYIADGLIGSGSLLYRRRDRHNAFCSVNESWDDPVTCWFDWHNLLPQHMPAVVLRGSPGWLQVIHGANVSNRVRGRLTSPSAHSDAFPGLLDGLPRPTLREFAVDALVSAPARGLREGARATVKAVVTATAGKDGLDRLKAIAATGRRSDDAA